MHFRVERDGCIIQEETDAFVYRWRLWSVPELRDAMREGGDWESLVPPGVANVVRGLYGSLNVRPV